MLRSATPLLLLVATLVPAASALGQVVVSGSGSARQTVTVGLIMPTLLRIRRAVEIEVVARRGDTLALHLPLDVSANAGWTLRVAPGDAPIARTLHVRDVNGAWRPLDPGSPPVTVIAEHGPCSDARIELEFQVVGLRSIEALRELTLDLRPVTR